MVLKGYVKRVAELKKKTKEQLINYIIDKERKRDDKLSNYINRVVSLTDIVENWKGKNCEARIEIAVLKMQLEMIKRENLRLIGEIKFKENDLNEAYGIISNHSKKIENEVLKKFNQLKSKIIQSLVEDKIKIIKEELRMQKDKEIIQIFEYLGVSKERLFEIIEKRI